MDIFIIKDFLTIVFIFIVISTMFWLICSLVFFRCLLNSGTYMELQTTSFIESMESEQANPVDSIKDVVQSSVLVTKFDKYLKKAGGHIGQNVVEITLRYKTIVQKTLMINIIKLHLRNLDI